MAIEFKCVCGNNFSVADEHAGKAGTCPKCKMPITVPGEAPRQDTPAEEAPRFPLETLMAYLQGHQSSNLFVLRPHISPQREQAVRDFFQIDAREAILGVFHPSLLIAGEEALVFSAKGVYVKKADLTRGHVLYESLLEGSIHLEGDRDIVIQAVKPQRLRYRILVSPGIAEYLSKVLRGLQLLLNGRDPEPIFAVQANNVLQELRSERSGLLPSSGTVGGSKPANNVVGSGGKRRTGIFGSLRGKGRA